MKVLVTGATGLVGRALVQALQSDGHLVCRLLRKKDEDEQETKQDCDVEWESARRRIRRSGRKRRRRGEFGGSAHRRWPLERDRKEFLRSSRVETTRGLVAAIEQMSPRPKVLVSASAIGYYGDRGDEVLTEESSPRADFLSRLAEEWEAEAHPGERSRSARGAGALRSHPGKTGRSTAADDAALQIGAGGKLGSGKQWMSWVTLDDVVRVIRFAMETEAVEGAVNVTAPQPVTNAEFTKALARAMHRPAFFTVPPVALRALLGEMADAMLLSSQRVVPQALEKYGYQFQYRDLRSALAAILKS